MKIIFRRGERRSGSNHASRQCPLNINYRMNACPDSDVPDSTGGPNLENLTEEERAAVQNVMARAKVSRLLCTGCVWKVGWCCNWCLHMDLADVIITNMDCVCL